MQTRRMWVSGEKNCPRYTMLHLNLFLSKALHFPILKFNRIARASILLQSLRCFLNHIQNCLQMIRVPRCNFYKIRAQHDKVILDSIRTIIKRYFYVVNQNYNKILERDWSSTARFARHAPALLSHIPPS